MDAGQGSSLAFVEIDLGQSGKLAIVAFTDQIDRSISRAGIAKLTWSIAKA